LSKHFNAEFREKGGSAQILKHDEGDKICNPKHIVGARSRHKPEFEGKTQATAGVEFGNSDGDLLEWTSVGNGNSAAARPETVPDGKRNESNQKCEKDCRENQEGTTLSSKETSHVRKSSKWSTIGSVRAPRTMSKKNLRYIAR
jgi:hypothetical protein